MRSKDDTDVKLSSSHGDLKDVLDDLYGWINRRVSPSVIQTCSLGRWKTEARQDSLFLVIFPYSVEDVQDLLGQGVSALARTEFSQSVVQSDDGVNKGGNQGHGPSLMKLPPLELNRPMRPSGLRKSISPYNAAGRRGDCHVASPSLLGRLQSSYRQPISPDHHSKLVDSKVIGLNEAIEASKPMKNQLKTSNTIYVSVVPFNSACISVHEKEGALVFLCDDSESVQKAESPNMRQREENYDRVTVLLALDTGQHSNTLVRISEAMFDQMVSCAKDAEESAECEGNDGLDNVMCLKWMMKSEGHARAQRIYKLSDILCFKDFEVSFRVFALILNQFDEKRY